MAEITLSGAVRTTLLILQRNQLLIDRTQIILASGLRVNSAIDDASAFFAALSLSTRAVDLGNLKSDIDQGISVLAAATNGIEAITALVEQAKGLTVTAKATNDKDERSALAEQFDALLLQIDFLTGDATFAGTNLIGTSPDNLTINFNEDGTSSLTISGIDTTTASTGLNIAGAFDDFKDNADINISVTAVDAALIKLRTTAATLGSNSSALQTRLTFTVDLQNTLTGGASKLTAADLTQETAFLLALQTRQQLGINSLALASQSARSILALFA